MFKLVFAVKNISSMQTSRVIDMMNTNRKSFIKCYL